MPYKKFDLGPVAAIDIGSNTVRFAAAGIKKDGKTLVFLDEDRKITRLGQGVDKNGRLADEGISRTVSCLKEFGERIQKQGIDISSVNAAATSAVRDSANREEFVKAVYDASGIKVRVIDGQEEAMLTISGILLGLGRYERDGGKDFVSIDIGGGSTEFTYYKPGAVPESVSINLGVVRLIEKHIKNDPPQEHELENMRDDIKKLLTGIDNKGIKELVGTAGTVTAFAYIDSDAEKFTAELINGYKLKLSSIEKIFEGMKRLPASQRKREFRLDSGREDVIIAGALILLTIMNKFGNNYLTVSDYGLREGLLLESLGDVS